MLLTLVGAIVLAVASAGIVSMTFKVLKKPMPKGLLPLVGGIAMVCFMAWNENSWFSRQKAELPDTMVVLGTGEFSNFVQPWTLIFPRVVRYSAVDTSKIISVTEEPKIRAVEMILAERYIPTKRVNELINCDSGEASRFETKPELDADGLPVNVQWYKLEDNDPRIDVVCK